jgi:hypothetical protein
MRIAAALSVGYDPHPIERKDARRTRSALMASRKKTESRQSKTELTREERRLNSLRTKTMDELVEEQGVRPFDWDEYKRTWTPLPFPDDFVDHIKELRRGRGPIRKRARR